MKALWNTGEIYVCFPLVERPSNTCTPFFLSALAWLKTKLIFFLNMFIIRLFTTTPRIPDSLKFFLIMSVNAESPNLSLSLEIV